MNIKETNHNDHVQVIIMFYEPSLRVCLFEGETEWMKNFENKMGRKTLLECVWLSREEGK